MNMFRHVPPSQTFKVSIKQHIACAWIILNKERKTQTEENMNIRKKKVNSMLIGD